MEREHHHQIYYYASSGSLSSNLSVSLSDRSASTDCVEKFIGDMPFAGLFKGSTMNPDNPNYTVVQHKQNRDYLDYPQSTTLSTFSSNSPNQTNYHRVSPQFFDQSITNHNRHMKYIWTFSIYLEAVAILPQLFMMSERGEVESTLGHYLFALGLHPVFYLFNWILSYNMGLHHYAIPMWSSVVQTILYWKFFYIYLTRVLWDKSCIAADETKTSLDQLREVVHQEFTASVEKSDNVVKESIEKQASSLKKSPSLYSEIY